MEAVGYSGFILQGKGHDLYHKEVGQVKCMEEGELAEWCFVIKVLLQMRLCVCCGGGSRYRCAGRG